MLRAMGWKEGQGLGSGGEGRTKPLIPVMPKRGVGLGGNRQRGPPRTGGGGGGSLSAGIAGIGFVAATATKPTVNNDTTGAAGPRVRETSSSLSLSGIDRNEGVLMSTYHPGASGRGEEVTELVVGGVTEENQRECGGGALDDNVGGGGAEEDNTGMGKAGKYRIGFFIDKGTSS